MWDALNAPSYPESCPVRMIIPGRTHIGAKPGSRGITRVKPARPRSYPPLGHIRYIPQAALCSRQTGKKSQERVRDLMDSATDIWPVALRTGYLRYTKKKKFAVIEVRTHDLADRRGKKKKKMALPC